MRRAAYSSVTKTNVGKPKTDAQTQAPTFKLVNLI